MAIEKGIVIGVDLNRGTALVKTIQHSSCGACSARDQCNQNIKKNVQEVEAVNLVNAKVGDNIQIYMDTKALLLATFLLYLFPILCMLIGAFAGHAIGIRINAHTVLSPLVGISCFAASMFIVRNRSGHMALKLKYKPKITRILGHAPPQSGHNIKCGLQTNRSIQENLT